MEPVGQEWDIGIGTLILGDDGVVYHLVDPGAAVGQREALHVYDVAAEALDATPRPHVVDLREVAYVDKAARDIFARGDERTPELATALIIKGGVSALLGNLTLKLSRLHHPVRVFRSEEEAVAWAIGLSRQNGSA